jgi:hypothetical protein
MIISEKEFFSLNSTYNLISVIVKYSVLFQVWSEFLNIISTNFRFKGLI